MDFLKDITKDKIKFYYLVSFSAIGIIAYMLLVRGDLGKMRDVNNTFRERVGNLVILETIAEYKDYVNKFNEDFTVPLSENRLLDMLTKIADDNAVKLDMVKPIESRQIGGYENVEILIEGSAPYQHLVNFLIDLETEEYYFIISSLDLTGRDIPQLPSEKKAASYPTRIGAFTIKMTCFKM